MNALREAQAFCVAIFRCPEMVAGVLFLMVLPCVLVAGVIVSVVLFALGYS